jgi:hypothetical protein
MHLAYLVLKLLPAPVPARRPPYPDCRIPAAGGKLAAVVVPCDSRDRERVPVQRCLGSASRSLPNFDSLVLTSTD